jgi:hypothetical protein
MDVWQTFNVGKNTVKLMTRNARPPLQDSVPLVQAC